MEVINIEKLLNSKINNITQDPYNHEYNAWSFNADNCSYKFRSAKIIDVNIRMHTFGHLRMYNYTVPPVSS